MDNKSVSDGGHSPHSSEPLKNIKSPKGRRGSEFSKFIEKKNLPNFGSNSHSGKFPDTPKFFADNINSGNVNKPKKQSVFGQRSSSKNSSPKEKINYSDSDHSSEENDDF